MKPDVRYMWNDGFAIAYQVLGAGETLVYLPGYVSNVALQWEIPTYARFLNHLASFSKLIPIDCRGRGCSDRLPPGEGPVLEEMVSDVIAVIETTASSPATVFAVQESGFIALLAAASYPNLISRLVLFGVSPGWVRSDDLPDETSRADWETIFHEYERLTSTTEFLEGYLRHHAPSLIGDDRGVRGFEILGFNSEAPGGSVGLARSMSQVDLRHVLPSVRVPTLVMRRTGDQLVPISSCRYLVDHIEGATFLELPGVDAMPWSGDHEPITDAIKSFMGAHVQLHEADRRLTTLLFTDVVGSTDRAVAVGDAAWRKVLEAHHRTVREQLTAYRGVEIDTAGDGFFAIFDGPAQAVRCAEAIAEVTASLGVDVRVGVHVGEVEQIVGKPGGVAVAICSRICAAAVGSEVLVSQTVKDLVSGSGLSFEDAGEHELKGVPDRWRLYRVVK